MLQNRLKPSTYAQAFGQLARLLRQLLKKDKEAVKPPGDSTPVDCEGDDEFVREFVSAEIGGPNVRRL